MPAVTSTGAELLRFRRGLLPRIALIALVLIPLLYGALYLWAFWDPTGQMDRLPVALVNSDREVLLDDGTTLVAGDDVVAALVDDASLDWVSATPEEADQGVRDGTYYFSLTIPEDFSAAVASAEGDDPEQARLDVTYNDANSFLASTLGHAAMVEVDDAVRATIGRDEADALVIGLGDARGGLVDASDAAVTLADATSALTVGSADLAQGAEDASSGATQVADGAAQLADGAARLSSGAGSAASGAADLADGASQADDGAADLASGADELSAALSQAASGAGALDEGAAQVAAGVDQAAATVQQISDELSQAPAALTQIGAYLQARAMTGDTDALAALGVLSSVSGSLGSLDPDAIAQDVAALQSGADQVATGAAALDASMGQLSAGASDLADGASGLADGVDQVADGASDLADGVSQVADGASDLAAATTDLADGSAQLASGTVQLADGADTLNEGSAQISDGAGQLSSGLADGLDQIPATIAEDTSQRSAVIATPVSLDESHLTSAEGFGEGFAPFFISLALFVGALITWLLMRPLPSRALATPASGWRATMAGFGPAAAIGVAQVVVMLAVIHLGVGLEMSTMLGTAAFTLLVALAFIALQQMLNAVLGPAPGKVVILALLMLQLASSGGTYPVETTPLFFRAIHPLLPMTYAVTGLREVVTGGADARLWTSVAVLAAVLLGSLALTAWRAGRMRTWTMSRLHPAISI